MAPIEKGAMADSSRYELVNYVLVSNFLSRRLLFKDAYNEVAVSVDLSEVDCVSAGL